MVIVIIAYFGLVKYDDWIYLAPVISLVSWLDLFIGLVIIKSFGDYSGTMINFIWPMIIRDYHYFPSLGHWLFRSIDYYLDLRDYGDCVYLAVI